MKTTYLLCRALTSKEGVVSTVLLMLEDEELTRLQGVMDIAHDLRVLYRDALGPQPAVRSYLTPWFFGYREARALTELAATGLRVGDWTILPEDFHPDAFAEQTVLQENPTITATEDEVVLCATEKYREEVTFRSVPLTRDLLPVLRAHSRSIPQPSFHSGG